MPDGTSDEFEDVSYIEDGILLLIFVSELGACVSVVCRTGAMGSAPSSFAALRARCRSERWYVGVARSLSQLMSVLFI